MKLPKEDAKTFYRLFHSLLIYTNRKFKITDSINSPEDLMELSLEEINKLRDKLYKQTVLIDSFISENPLNFLTNELEIISSWKNFVKSTFYIFRYLKNYTIFLGTNDPPKAYGVLALKSPLEEIIGPYLPIMVKAVLLPFKNIIIYDSILLPHTITFGGGIRRSLNDTYQEAKSRFGIIASLPFSLKKVEQSEADKLRFYLRSKRNREIYWEEVENLVNKDLSFLTLYHQEMGKIHARTYGKQLREIGLVDVWFAILKGVIVASGKTKKQVENILKDIIPSEKRDWCYIFHLKRK